MKSVRNIFISFISFFILWIIIVYTQMGNPTQNSQWIYEAYLLKEKYGLTIRKPKIVIVSGSNSLFGINSKAIEDEWGIPIVNDAVHAGLGLPYILYKSKQILHKGDIAILPLEYSFYGMSNDKIPWILSDYIMSRDTKYFFSLSPIKQVNSMISVKLKRVIEGLKSNSGTIKKTTGIYGIQNMNYHGDQINIEYKKMSPEQLKHLDSLTADKLSSTDLSESFIKCMSDYIRWSQEHGITLIFMPPNHMYFKYYDSRDYQTFLDNIRMFYSEKGALYIGRPRNYMYDKKYYFNTSYHLNDRGVEKRTKQLINDINKKWGAIHLNAPLEKLGVSLNSHFFSSFLLGKELKSTVSVG